MKKINNKGFAITGIIYGLLLIFVLVISTFLSILIGRSRRMDSLIEDVHNGIGYSETFLVKFNQTDNTFEVGGTVVETTGAFVTRERGKYNFNNQGSCSKNLYLPKNVVIISEQLKNPDSSLIKFYYKLGGGTDLEQYLPLC